MVFAALLYTIFRRSPIAINGLSMQYLCHGFVLIAVRFVKTTAMLYISWSTLLFVATHWWWFSLAIIIIIIIILLTLSDCPFAFWHCWLPCPQSISNTHKHRHETTQHIQCTRGDVVVVRGHWPGYSSEE